MLLVSWGFGNPNITRQDPEFISEAASVCFRLVFIHNVIQSPQRFQLFRTGISLLD